MICWIVEDLLDPWSVPPRALDLLTDAAPEIAYDEVVYRLALRAMPIAGLPEHLRIAGVDVTFGPGPLLTQATKIRQRPGRSIVFDKAMTSGLSVGESEWLTLCQIRSDINPSADLSEQMVRWREQARAAVGALAAVLDERIALEPVLEDVLYRNSGALVGAADMRRNIRPYQPYAVRRRERVAIRSISGEALPGEPTSPTAARWYLRGTEAGPTADGVVYFWIAIEALTDFHTLSPKRINRALRAAGWDPSTLPVSIGKLAGLRADIVHRGLDDLAQIREGYYVLEAVARVLLRESLDVRSSWPAVTGTATFIDPYFDEITASVQAPDIAWHEDLPQPEAGQDDSLVKWTAIPAAPRARIKLTRELPEANRALLEALYSQALAELAPEIEELTIELVDTQDRWGAGPEGVQLSPTIAGGTDPQSIGRSALAARQRLRATCCFPRDCLPSRNSSGSYTEWQQALLPTTSWSPTAAWTTRSSKRVS
jgi:hypothetical protein